MTSLHVFCIRVCKILWKSIFAINNFKLNALLIACDYIIYNIQKTIYRKQYTENNIQKTIYRKQYTENNIQKTIYRKQYTENNIVNQ